MKEKLGSISRKIEFSEHSNIPEYMEFKTAEQKTFEEFSPWLKQTFNLPESFGLKLLSQEDDQIGYTHYRYQQTNNGFPVEYTMYIIHVKLGKVVSMNGLLFDEFDKITDGKYYDEKYCLEKALNYIDASQYIWEKKELNGIFGDSTTTVLPKGSKVYITKEYNPTVSSYSLAYKFDIYAIEPLKREYVFVDIYTGEVITSRSRIHNSDTLVTAKTGYSKRKQITVDYAGANQFKLTETSRGNGIATYNLHTGTNFNNYFDFNNADTFWNNVNPAQDQYATDAHWAAEKSYDYYKSTFGRNSIDNKGFQIKNFVHYDKNYLNAFWDGSQLAFGDADTTYYTPLRPFVSVDICGHELTHGLSENTAAFSGLGESGILNEAFSDIFGTMIEWYADSTNFEWEMGKKIGGMGFRAMNNPNSYNQPDTYNGKYWDKTLWNDHQNTGVPTYWFYILAQGDSGINDLNVKYNIKPLGKKKATEIAYRALTVYLPPNSGIKWMRYYTLQATKDLYGACSDEVMRVAAAWNAVGVGSTWDTVSRLTLSETPEITHPNFTRSSTINQLLRLNVFRACQSQILDTATSFTIDFSGTTNLGDLSKVSIWYCRDDTALDFLNPFGYYSNPTKTFTIKGSQPLMVGDNFFWITCDIAQYAALNDTIDAACTSVKVNGNSTAPNPTSTAMYHKISYCVPPLNIVDACKYYYIKNVTMDSLSHSSQCSYNFYADNNNIGIDKGQGENVKYKITTDNNFENINIWIDFDTNGRFDFGEWVVNNAGTGVSNNTVSGFINIPFNAIPGRHQMRIHTGFYYQSADTTGCNSLNEGETEDYYINVTPAKPMVYVSSHTIEDSSSYEVNTVNNKVIGVKINTKHAISPLSAKEFIFNMNGTTDSTDIKNARLWYTGNSNVFATTTAFGPTVKKPGNSNFSISDSVKLIEGENYFWLTCDVNYNAKQNHYVDAECISIKIDSVYTPDTVAPVGIHKISYCVPKPNNSASTCLIWITNTTLDSINNNSGCNNSVYVDYTNLSTSIEQGDQLPFSITVGGANYGYFINMWIDADNNGNFASNEWFVQNINPIYATTTGTITIPSNMSIGAHQIRVKIDGIQQNSGDACTNVFYGEVEDYTLNVIKPKPMKYISSTTKQNRNSVERGTIDNDIISIKIKTKGMASPLKAYKFKINANGTTDTTNIKNIKMWTTGSDSVYKDSIQFGKTNIKSSSNIYNFSDSAILKSGTNYFWVSYDIAANSKLGNLLDAECISLTVDSTHTPDSTAPYGNREIGYCTPTGGYNNDYNYVLDSLGITKIELNTISNSSAVPRSYSDFYSDYHYIKTTLIRGNTYNLYITPGQSAAVWYQASIAWVDWNQNSKFDASEKLGHIDLQTGRDFISFKVPANQNPGDYRLRIMSGYYDAINNGTCSWDPCTGQTPAGSWDQSECEDYTISIIYPKPVISPSSKINLCINSKQLLTTAYYPTFNYYWYLNGTTLLDSGLGHPHDSFTYIAKTAGTDTISVKVVDDLGQIGISPAIYIITNPKSIVGSFTSTANNICAGDTVKLKLSGQTGTINWQNLTNGAWSSFGSSTDSIYIFPNANNDYRVLVKSGACPADSSGSVAVSVSQKPHAGIISSSASIICMGDSSNLVLKGNSGTCSWQYLSSGNWKNIGSSASSIYVSPGTATDYRVFAISAFCPSDSSQPISILVNTKPIAGIISASDTNLCVGDSASIIVTGNSATFDWQYNNSGSWNSLSSSQQSIIVKPNVSTNYRVVASSGVCSNDSSNMANILVHPIPVAIITASNSKLCPGDSVELSSTKAIDYLWSTGEKTQNIYIKSNATVSVSIIDSFGCKNTSVSQNYIFHTVLNPVITRSGDTMFVSPSNAISYNWKLNGSFVITTTKNYCVPIQKGLYTVEYIDSNGCLSQASQSFNYITGIESISNISDLKVYPNPSEGVYYIISNTNYSRISIRVTDIMGKAILQETYTNQSGKLNLSIDLSRFAKGVYLLHIDKDNEKNINPIKLIKE